MDLDTRKNIFIMFMSQRENYKEILKYLDK